MTVKEGERGVSIEEKMKLLNPLLTNKYHEHLIQNGHSDKGSQSCLGAWSGTWTGVHNLAETIIKLQEAMDKKNGNEKKGVDTEDVHLY